MPQELANLPGRLARRDGAARRLGDPGRLGAMDYSVEVSRRPARIVDRSGSAVDAVFFLHGSAVHPEGHETLAERLNDSGVRFLPCEIEDGIVELVRLDWIAYVEIAGLPHELPDLDEMGAYRAPVGLDLVSGESFDGELVYLAPPSAARVSDLLNRDDPRFLTLLRRGRTLYVNRDAIFRVRFDTR